MPCVVLTHEHADFDAIASLMGAARLYPAYVPILPREINRNVETFISLYGDQLPFGQEKQTQQESIDCVFLVDTQSIPSIRGLRADVAVHVVDHHAPAKDFPKQWRFQGRTTGACASLLTEDLEARQISLTPIEATLLLLGIYEDTGSLTYASTTADDLKAAAWLMGQGGRLDLVHEYLHPPLSPEQGTLLQLLVHHAEFHTLGGHTVALSLVQAGEYVGEISTLAHLIRNLYDPAALFLAVQMNAHIQIVARSTTDSIDVGHVTRHLGGGGHPRAAAAFREGQSLDELRKQILALLATHIRPAATVSQIMSYGLVHTLTPEATIRHADALMRRWGHEGFPVIERGTVVGVLRRQDVDKALHHGLGDAQARKFMRKGQITISPRDSVDRLQDVMTSFRIGQVPVVEEGRVVGIVTRTDLLKLWTAQPPTPKAEQIATQLQHVFKPLLQELIREIGNEASQLGYSLYLVGGFVRDLLLAQQTPAQKSLPAARARMRSRLLAGDIDLVVEGDAIALARRLADLHGGRVRSHARFGTAKWLLAGSHYAQVRPFVDLVTARTEFYESPSALPSVERSSIRQDLHRRDFTINTLAICLDEARYGYLLDFYGGEKDLAQGIVRVLHNLSFIEDPTRILRAVRMEQRFDFHIEERTKELLRDSVGLLSRVSGSRLRNELYALFQEAAPGRCLARLQELGVLSEIHPAIRYDDWLANRFVALPQQTARWKSLGTGSPAPADAGGDIPLRSAHFLALLVVRLGRQEVAEIVKRLALPRRDATLVEQAQALYALQPQLQAQTLRTSRLYRLLRPFNDDARLILWAVTDIPAVRRRLEQFQTRLRYVSPYTDGHKLRALGLEPGPIYRDILEKIRDARLDGDIVSVEDEEAFVKTLLSEGDSK